MSILNITLSDLDWSADAPCTQVDPEIFFPVGNGTEMRRQVAVAQAVCAGCPVIQQCAEHAIDDGHGIWAGVYIGTHPADRALARRKLRRIADGEAADTPRRERPVRPGREPAQCTGEHCDRLVRAQGRRADEYPGTFVNRGRGMCSTCFVAYMANERATAHAITDAARSVTRTLEVAAS